ncbi:MAG TPA: hypothetical protein VJI73_01850 [Candidatus Paceibacterota bacterium]
MWQGAFNICKKEGEVDKFYHCDRLFSSKRVLIDFAVPTKRRKERQMSAELWQLHQTEILKSTSVPFIISVTGTHSRPELGKLVADWRDKEGNPFPQADLGPRRMGVAFPLEEDGRLKCFPVSWAEYSLMSKKAIRDSLPESERFHVLAISCLARTHDGQFVLSFRSRKVSHYKNMYHVSAAGYLDLGSAMASQSSFPQLFQELEEELGVAPTAVEFCQQLGLCRHAVPDSAVVEICYFAQLKLTADELLDRAKGAKDGWEGKVTVCSAERALEELKSKPMNPAGAATLMLYFQV